MQLFIGAASDPNRDARWGESPWYRRRSLEDLTEKVEGLRMAAHCDSSHVPKDRPLRVQVRRADEQHPSPSTFIGDAMEEVVVDIFCDQVFERRAVDQARSQ